MVVYIQKRLNISVCIPSRAGAEGEGWPGGVYGEPATVSDMPHQRAISGYAPENESSFLLKIPTLLQSVIYHLLYTSMVAT